MARRLRRLELLAIAPTPRRNPETGGIDGEHAFIAGLNRYGKTVLAKSILLPRKNIVVHDPKGTFTFFGRRFTRVEHVRDLYGLDPVEHPVLVYSPPRGEDRSPSEQDAFCDYVYQRGNCWLLLDELTRICSATWAPEALLDLYSRGAERGISIVGLSQQPVGAHPLTLSQAHHLYTFYLANEAHRKKVAGFMPVTTEQIARLRRYQFLYWRNDLPKVVGPFFLPKPAGNPAAAA